MKNIYYILLSTLLMAGCNGNKGGGPSPVTPVIEYEFSGGAGHYNYAPSVIEDKYGIRYAFVCQNRDPFVIVDYIYLFKGIPTKEGYKWQPGTELVAPSEAGWDTHHICDPDVREFKVSYKGEQYNWIMTYLGVDQWDCNHNQIGLAFSKAIEGPWVKYDKNPIVGTETRVHWGLGQSTSVVLDSTTIRLFYNHSTEEKQGFAFRDINLSNTDSIGLGKEYFIEGMFGNNYPAVSKSYTFMVSEEWINEDYEPGIPTWVGNYSKLRMISNDKPLTTPRDEWRLVGEIGPKQSGFPRNHNPGILTDTKGYMLNEDELIVYFSNSVTGDDWLWSYDLYSAKFDIKSFINNKK